MTDDLVEDLTYVRVVLDGLAEALVRFGRPMPPSVSRARGILNRALMSFGRQEIDDMTDDDGAENNIGTDELAEQLGVHRRTVQRNAESLGGQQISGAWVFDKNKLGA